MLAMKYLAGGGVSDVFNLGSENGFSVREIIEVAKKVTGVDFKVVEEGRRSGDPAVLIASSAKCKRHWDGIRQEAVQKRLLPQHGNGICHILTDMAGKTEGKPVMGYKDAYRDWLSWCDDAEKKELLLLKDEKEIEDRFYRDLEFGTAGLRGIMGAGSNRMNRYNVRKATKGFADYLQDTYGKRCQDGVIIAYDSRNNSADFAAEAAHVLCAAGIPVKFSQSRNQSLFFLFRSGIFVRQAGSSLLPVIIRRNITDTKFTGRMGGSWCLVMPMCFRVM